MDDLTSKEKARDLRADWECCQQAIQASVGWQSAICTADGEVLFLMPPGSLSVVLEIAPTALRRALYAERRVASLALEIMAAEGQAHEAYEKQLDAEAEVERLKAELAQAHIECCTDECKVQSALRRMGDSLGEVNHE